MRVKLEVAGTPAPKGSMRAMMAGGRAILIPGGSKQNEAKLMGWDQAVRLVANRICAGRSEPMFVDVALELKIVFRLKRPAGHWRKAGGLKPSAAKHPKTKPDLDKLTRATADSLHGTIYDDDSRIVRKVAEKVYAAPGEEGATIIVGPISMDLIGE